MNTEQYEALSAKYSKQNAKLNEMITANGVDDEGRPNPLTDEIKIAKSDLQELRAELDAAHRDHVLNGLTDKEIAEREKIAEENDKKASKSNAQEVTSGDDQSSGEDK